MRRSITLIFGLIVVVAVVAGAILLIRGRGLATGATLPPDGTYVAYLYAPLQTSADLYALNTETGESVQLTQGSQTVWAVWSPDGQRIALNGGDRQGSALYLLDVETGALTEITDSLSGISFGRYGWSPDGARLAWEGTYGEQRGIFMSAGDGNPPVYLADGGQPAWSPDGGQLLFVDTQGTGLNVLDVAGGKTQSLLDQGAQIVDPQWSPDGAQIAFVVDMVSKKTLYVADADGGNVHLVSEIFRTIPVRWSPDGAYLLFEEPTGAALCQVAIDGGEQVCTSDSAAYGVWSPAGDQIAYTATRSQLCITPGPLQKIGALTPRGQCFDVPEDGLVIPIGWRP